MRTWRISLWTLALVSLLVLGCDKNNNRVSAPSPVETAQGAGAPTTPASKEGLAVSGPYASANLTVWLVHGPAFDPPEITALLARPNTPRPQWAPARSGAPRDCTAEPCRRVRGS